MKVKIKRLHETVKMPNYGHPGDVGLDLYNASETTTIQPGERHIFSCGFALEFPEGYAAIVKDKSSVPKEYGLHTMAGVYDAGFRGEYNVMMVNLGNEPATIEHAQKIAQLVILPVEHAELETVDELTDSSRGEGKFGSTGKF